MARVLFEFAALDFLDDVDEVSRWRAPGYRLLALADHEPVQDFDFRAPSLYHVLISKTASRGSHDRQPALILGLECFEITLAGAGNRFPRQMIDLFELVAARLADADRPAAASLRGRAHLLHFGRNRRLGKDFP